MSVEFPRSTLKSREAVMRRKMEEEKKKKAMEGEAKEQSVGW